MDLESLRKRIDEIDLRLVDLLNERMHVALDIGRTKRRGRSAVYAPDREKAVLARVTKANRGPMSARNVEAIYREIMSAAISLEKRVQVAFFGTPGTFTHQAACSRFGASVEYLGCETITDVFAAVQKGRADYGVVPVENSTEGAVSHTLDLFPDTPLRVCAEILLPVSHHLMARCAAMADVRRIYTHPQVLGQCRRWLQAAAAGIEQIPVASTTRAAEMAAREPDAAAIASETAAALHGLRILERDIQDLSDNVTRFFVIATHHAQRTGEDKTSIMFLVKHRVGALCGALESFKRHGINMTKIESRPHKARQWEYYFFVDFEGHPDDPAVQTALADLREHCLLLTVLGAYPKARMP